MSVCGRKMNVQDASHSHRLTLLSGCLSRPDAWSPVSAVPGLDPTCSGRPAPASPAVSCLPPTASARIHGFLVLSWRVCGQTPSPRRCISQLADATLVSGLWTPVPFLTGLMTSIPTDARFLAPRAPWEPDSAWGGGRGSGCSPSQAPSTH